MGERRMVKCQLRIVDGGGVVIVSERTCEDLNGIVIGYVDETIPTNLQVTPSPLLGLQLSECDRSQVNDGALHDKNCKPRSAALAALHLVWLAELAKWLWNYFVR